jgi:LysM repeat protein
MNTPTPLIREGLKPLRGKSPFFFKVMLVLTVHVVLIGGLLLQGCKDTTTKDASLAPPAPDPTSPTDAANADQKLPPVANTNSPNAVANQPLQPATVAPTAPGAAPADTAVYTVKPGDTLGKIARLHHTSSAKIKAMNDLNTTFIKVGQKLKIPGSKAA